MTAFVADLDACPKCGVQWAYEVDGKRYSYLGGIYSREQDRTIAWRCPGCETEWKRDATADEEAETA